MSINKEHINNSIQGPTIRGAVYNFLENLSLVLDGIASIFGKNCEVVLHDLRKPERSIVKIINGHVTRRKKGGPLIGGPLDDEGLKVILEGSGSRNVLSNYISSTRDGRKLKSTSILFRNAKGKAIAALCINLDLTQFSAASELLGDILKTEEEPKGGSSKSDTSSAPAGDIEPLMRAIVDEAMVGIQKPIRLAEKTDKIKAIKVMYDRGLFLLKGGVDFAAGALGISRFTVYNYLKELRYRKNIE